MANLSLNGTVTGGHIYPLNIPEGKNIIDVKRQAENDGLDQVYFKVEDDYYVVEGDGLDLSGLKANVYQPGELTLHVGTPQEKSVLATVQLVDNETNTAWEGVKSAGWATLSAFGLGALGGGALAGKAAIQAGPALGQVQLGMTAMKGGFSSVKAGMLPMNQGMELSIGAVQKVIGAPKSKGIIGGILDGAGRAVGLPERAKEISQGMALMKEGAVTAQKGLHLTETGIKHFDESMAIVKSSSSTLKTAGKVVLGGAIVAGTIAGAGALYGTLRGEQVTRLNPYKGDALK